MNIYDVAKRAGVSTATVSRVLNGSNRVSEKTMARVKQVIDELNYRPSQIAVGLATNSTKTIGIMLPDVRDSFHAAVAFLIESELSPKGYTCILCNTSVRNNNEVDYLNALYNKKVDGIILVGSSYNKKEIDQAYERWHNKIPIVLINAISIEGTASVICNEKAGMLQALTHLKERGKKYPIFIKDASDYQTRSSYTKALAFMEAYKGVYRMEQPPDVYSCLPKDEPYRELIHKLKSTDTDSILFTNDMSCAIFLKSLQKEGFCTPKDFALIGFNNAKITDITTPTITTIDHYVSAHCQLAIEKLLRMIAGEMVEKVTFITPNLVIKETT